jgi:hypothetical protein
MRTNSRREGGFLFAFVIVALAVSASAASAATVTDEKYHLVYTVSDTWKSAPAGASDINQSIIRKSYLGVGGGFIVTAKSEDYAIPAQEWGGAVVGGLSQDKTLQIENTIGDRVIGNSKSIVVTLQGRGTGMKIGAGATPLKRIIVLIPNGPDVIQFILTAPVNKFSAPKAEFEKVLASVVFTGKSKPRKVRATDENASDDVQPPTNEASTAAAPAGGAPVDYWQASKSAATRAVVLLAQRGLSVYQSVTDDAAVEVVACDPKGGKLVPVQAAIPVIEGAADAELGWQLNSSRMRAGDVVVLLKSGNRIGWVVPWEMLKEYATPIAEGSVIVEVKSSAKLKETVLLEALAPYADVKKAFPQ